MDIYLTNRKTGEVFQFPMLPTELPHDASAKLSKYDIIDRGEVAIPNGLQLRPFRWSGILPGYIRRNEPYVRKWMDPKAIEKMWEEYRINGTKLRLLITETPVNLDVYLESYNITYTGAHGDYQYEISLVEAKDLAVSSTAMSMPATGSSARSAPPTPSTYTVKSGDTLYGIAKKCLGQGSYYPQIYELNRGIIKDPNLIKPGMVLTLPSGANLSAMTTSVRPKSDPLQDAYDRYIEAKDSNAPDVRIRM